MQLTHYGRKTGQPHTVTTWFAVDGETLYVPTSDRGRQWARNVLQHAARTAARRAGIVRRADHAGDG